MKFKHGVSALLVSTILMAGCTTDRGEIKNYNKDYKLAPWLGNADKAIKLRVDLELNGETGEINGVKYTRCRFTKIF